MSLSICRLQLISITFLLFWIFALALFWRNPFHSQEEADIQKINNDRGLHKEGLSRSDSDRRGAELNQARTRISHNHNQTKQKKRRRKERRKHVDTKLPLPIVNVGFPKAGTSSIFSFFQQQNFRSQHWYCCKAQHDPQLGGPELFSDCMLRNMKKNRTTHNRTILQGCGNFHVYSEINGPRCDHKKGCLLENGTYDSEGPGPRIFMPQHFNLEQLHEASPNATWILNLRDVDSWIRSVMKWGDLQNQLANEYLVQQQIHRLPTNQTEMKEFLKTIYSEHNDLIRQFVRDNPSHILVEVNIADIDAGEVLAEAFGLDASKWVQVNKNFGNLYFGWQRSSNTFLGSKWWWIFIIATTVYLGRILEIRFVYFLV